MLCQNCKLREANTHIVRTIGNQTEETYLCSECAKELGHNTEFSISNFLFGDMLSSPFFSAKENVCPVCHTSFTEISQSGNVGCGECYKTFSERLMPTISRLHNLPLHKGKVPGKSEAAPVKKAVRLTKEQKIEKYKKEQEEAIKKEDFEKAAELRDKIKKLEGGKDGE